MGTGETVFLTILGMGILSGIVTYFVEKNSTCRPRGGGELCVPVPEPPTLVGLLITVPLLTIGIVGTLISGLFNL